MTQRRSTSDRREQVIQVTLELLADLPLPEVTTRRIAERMGVTQPSLFRHFASRDEIVRAALEHTRQQLAGVAAEVLAAGRGPVDRLERLVLAILAHVQENPGVPRLLFQDALDSATFRTDLERLASAQRSVFSGLIREALDVGEVANVDAASASRLVLALIQGTVLQWQLGGRGRDLLVDGRSALAVVRAGLAAGLPGSGPQDAGQRSTTPDAGQEERSTSPLRPEGLVALDVRPILDRGEEPFGAIMEAVSHLAPDGVFCLQAPFRPVPLLSVLSGRGFTLEDRQVGKGHWVVEARGPAAPEPLELRDLPAPEPLEQVLAAVEDLEPGEALIARVPMMPNLLLPRLEERGLAWEAHEEPEGTAIVHVRRPS